jgi:hypothetical protein
MQPINKLKPGFLNNCLNNVQDTEPPIFCKFCGAIKQEFISPLHESRVIVLDCKCEQEKKALKEFYEAYRGCTIKKSEMNIIKYSEIIDGFVVPKNEEEKEIFRIGVITKDKLRDLEIKLAR